VIRNESGDEEIRMIVTILESDVSFDSILFTCCFEVLWKKLLLFVELVCCALLIQ
jgi:hypothetical protein